eukprot:gene1867-1008_t
MLKDEQYNNSISDMYSENCYLEKKIPHLTEKKMKARTNHFINEVYKNTDPYVLYLAQCCLEKYLSVHGKQLGDKHFKCFLIIFIANIHTHLMKVQQDSMTYYDQYFLYTQYITLEEFQKYEMELHEEFKEEYVKSELSELS